MTDAAKDDPESDEIALEYELDAAPEKVWRAIALPDFRERWLPAADLADPEPVVCVPGVEVRYRMRDDDAPRLKSTVTFRIEPGSDGGTLFRVIHRVEAPASACANDNGRALSLAA